MKKYIFILIIPVIFSSCFEDEVQFDDSYEGNFDALWHIVDTRYCYLDYKNINWDSIRTVYKPRLAYVNDKYELFDLFAEMLAELKDGHVNLTSEFDRSRYWKWYTDYPSNFSSSIIYSDRYLGDKYRSAGGFRYKAIADGKVGYMYYSDFSSSFSTANINSILGQFKDCEALIIDVRNNGGGSLGYSETLASYFFDEAKTTGYMRHKTGDGHSDFSDFTKIVTPANKKWNKPVAVLTNRMSYSATNDFVNRMKHASNTIIVGDNTGGGGGMPISSELPIGWTIRFSASPMYDTDKNHTEWGIAPDEKVDMDTSDTQSDAIIEKAIELVVSD